MGTSAATTGRLSDLRRVIRGGLSLTTVAPLPQTLERDLEVAALAGEPVLVALGPLAVADAFEDPFLDESVEPVGEDVAGDPEARRNSSKRRSPRKASRTISNVQRSPTTSSARAIEQF